MNTDTILRACAWCNHLLTADNDPVELAQALPAPGSNISHGCCNKCRVGVDQELAEYKASREKVV